MSSHAMREAPTETRLDAESDVESPIVSPGPDLLAVSEVKTEEEVHEDNIAPQDPVVKIEEGPALIKVEPPLIERVYQEVRRAHSEERISPGEYPPPAHAHDQDVKLSLTMTPSSNKPNMCVSPIIRIIIFLADKGTIQPG